MDKLTIKKLAQAPIEFVGQIPAPSGVERINLKANDLEAFCDDPEGYFALKQGVTKDEYVQWLATEGTPRCGAKTSKGIQCRNIVSGGIHMGLQDWLQEDGGFCHLHGGASSREARRKR